MYIAAGRYLMWPDIPNDRMIRFDETDASVSVFRSPSFNSNGNTVDREGRLVTCEHLARRVSRTERDGSITVLADQYERTDSPNDVVVQSDGSIWFSDPTYGIDSDHAGRRSESEIGTSNVYRIDGGTGRISLAVSDRVKPNGLVVTSIATYGHLQAAACFGIRLAGRISAQSRLERSASTAIASISADRRRSMRSTSIRVA